MSLSRVVQAGLDLLFPPSCLGCGRRLPLLGSKNFCAACVAQIHYLSPPLCRICGLEVYSADQTDRDNPLCGECLRNPPPYAMARSVVLYEPEVRKLVHRLKFARDLSVVPALAEIVACCPLPEFADIDCIVAVPLHPRRLRWRGLNQAVILARLFFADRLPLIHADWLQRQRNTVPQTELGGAARRKNLTGVFAVRPGNDFAGARVCLVDDVFTTGTTVRECSKVIMQSGAREVKVLTLARVNTPQRGRRL